MRMGATRSPLRLMILRPTGLPVSRRASKRLSNAARSCARHDPERNALSCWQTLQNGTLMHPSLSADHSFIFLEGACLDRAAQGRTPRFLTGEPPTDTDIPDVCSCGAGDVVQK